MSLSVLKCSDIFWSNSFGESSSGIAGVDDTRRYAATVRYMCCLRYAREGQGHDESNEGSTAGLRSLEGGAMVYLYNMQAFALALEVAR